MAIGIDFETRSCVCLKARGLYVYAEDPSTDVLCLGWRDERDIGRPPEIWAPGDPLPARLCMAVSEGETVTGWNVMFEHEIWNRILAPKYGFPALDLAQLEDTMAQAQSQGYPGHLADAAPAARLGDVKDAAGHRLMLQMCKPRAVNPDGSVIWWGDPEKLARLYDYCRQDVITEQGLRRALQPLSKSEQNQWLLCQRENLRGVQIDLALAAGAENLTKARLRELDHELAAVTRGAVTRVTQVARLKSWIGLDPDTDQLDAQTIKSMLARKSLPSDTRRALEIRQEAGKASTSKLTAYQARTSRDGRLRGMFRFHGAASTGRKTGSGVQLQNLVRMAELRPWALDMIRRGDITAVTEFIPGGAMRAAQSVLRPIITAAPGHTLVVADWSQIESRYTAWLADDQDKLDVFRQGRDIYKAVGAGMFGRPEDEIEGDDRQAAKTTELACGFLGGPGALDKMARKFGLVFEDAFLRELVEKWRAANSRTVQLGNRLESLAKAACSAPGEVQHGPRGMAYVHAKGHLWCRLPSGRRICYPWARLANVPAPWDGEQTIQQILYEGPDPVTHQWTDDRSAWRGILLENAVQAGCADLLRHVQADPWVSEIMVLDVHDEVGVEVPESQGEQALTRLTRVMTENMPAWTDGLPLAVDGYVSQRFRK